ncbi:MAG: type II toxin-antitoxin system VapC family toxin [Enhydrobacter sp.]|nr:type II toxin-antitoxin system VapC family toxin [Enhydrobacter sp.]
MIGLDTNVLIRHITQDDPVQSPRASALIEGRLTEDEPGFISVVTLAETAWVLDRSYEYSSMEIATAIGGFLQTTTFVVENEVEVFFAMTALKQGRAGFTDALIAALGTRAGCSTTMTFDREAARPPGFSLV